MDIDDKYCAISRFFHNLCEKNDGLKGLIDRTKKIAEI